MVKSELESNNGPAISSHFIDSLPSVLKSLDLYSLKTSDTLYNTFDLSGIEASKKRKLMALVNSSNFQIVDSNLLLVVHDRKKVSFGQGTILSQSFEYYSDYTEE